MVSIKDIPLCYFVRIVKSCEVMALGSWKEGHDGGKRSEYSHRDPPPLPQPASIIA